MQPVASELLKTLAKCATERNRELTVRELAKAVGVSHSTVVKLLNPEKYGRYTAPISNVENLLNALGYEIRIVPRRKRKLQP